MKPSVVPSGPMSSRTRKQSEGLGRAEGKQDRLADTQILVNYRESKLARESLPSQGQDESDSAPRAGDRAPDCDGLRMDHVHSPLRLFDILRGTQFVLLIYEPDKIELPPLGTLTKVVAICGGDRADLTGVPVLRDAAGTFAAAYRPQPGTCYLIRPDGYIGYRARPFQGLEILRYFEETGIAARM